MENNEINTKEVCDILNEIMEYELAGVVRYTHSSMMVSGPYRLPIVTFLKEQAEESLLHAQLAGEKIAGLDGHPSQKIAKIIKLPVIYTLSKIGYAVIGFILFYKYKLLSKWEW